MAIRNTLRDAALAPGDIGHIHAHGLSTTIRDAEEARGIAAVFGERTSQVPVVAAKSYFGNLGAGSGVIELIASLLALRVGRLFPTLNFIEPDPVCPIRVAADAEVPGSNFLNVSVTPQGQASAVLVRLL